MTNEGAINAAYYDALAYLNTFINLEHQLIKAKDLDESSLVRLKKLLDRLGIPLKLPAIHIAGTNGKGSTAVMCAVSLRAAGLRVGLYTSPHLIDLRERIRILTPTDKDGFISKAEFAKLVDEIRPILADFAGISWFEIITALAFWHFVRQDVDVFVIEAGLGGRVDGTNVITPLVSVITHISLDHTEFLGSTLAQIAQEKAGIIKPGVPVITAPQAPEAMSRLNTVAAKNAASIVTVGKDWKFEGRKQELIITHAPSAFSLQPPAFFPLPSAFLISLAGEHQLENGAVAVAALTAVSPHFPQLTLESIRAGLANVQWHGRLQTLHAAPDTPTLLVDCAHNADAAIRLRHALLHDYTYERLWLIFAASAGKDISGILTQLLPLAAGATATISSHPRAARPEAIVKQAAHVGFSMVSEGDLATAVTQTWQQAGPHDLICVTGSIFVVGDLLNQWENLRIKEL